MKWIQLRFACSANEAEMFEELLLETEAVSVTFQDAQDQPILEPGVGQMPLWNKVTMVALYTEDTDMDRVLLQIKSIHPDFDLSQAHIENLADQNWVQAWMDDFKPMQFGDRLWICPTAHQPVDPTAVNVILDPGLAFGTGTHPTTALCLRWLGEQDLNNKTIIDYGCGSGILAIAAVMLGAKKAYCVDNDPQALTATENNAKQNRLDSTQIISLLPDALPNFQADIMVANILAGPLVELAPHLSNLTKDHGKICLSGILDSQAKQVAEAYEKFFKLGPIVYSGEWTRISGVKK
ncbi:MAG: Ribosomal protein methyltransferase [Gammaproteobacteria bacterium]|nr:Ribosomal protein methyltransferase [Gammaproteobacteria bacterium]